MTESATLPASSPPLRVRAFSLVLGPGAGLVISVLVGLALGGILHALLPVFQLPERLQNLSGNLPNELLMELKREMSRVDFRNAAFALALWGGGLAWALTTTELCLRRQRGRAVWGGLLAGLVAALVAAGGMALAAALQDSLAMPDSRLVKSTLVQGTLFGIAGLGIGLGLALPLRPRKLLLSCLIGGLLGGMVAGALFPILASVALPNLNTDFLMPDEALGRLLWTVLAAGFIGVTITGLSKERAASGSVD